MLLFLSMYLYIKINALLIQESCQVFTGVALPSLRAEHKGRWPVSGLVGYAGAESECLLGTCPGGVVQLVFGKKS
jgi:hypothetical protein